ncbi:hypothetical protein NC651_007794 [Populus alba x Populus x berolinensis]|nr:hypothetical protein NC651_007794 [Populus alba x Populus x berolinensis]
MPITLMRTRWLTGKQHMHTRPQIYFKWNQSPAATWQWISAQFALVSSLLCPCLFSSTSRIESQRGLNEINMVTNIISNNKPYSISK